MGERGVEQLEPGAQLMGGCEGGGDGFGSAGVWLAEGEKKLGKNREVSSKPKDAFGWRLTGLGSAAARHGRLMMEYVPWGLDRLCEYTIACS